MRAHKSRAALRRGLRSCWVWGLEGLYQGELKGNAPTSLTAHPPQQAGIRGVAMHCLPSKGQLTSTAPDFYFRRQASSSKQHHKTSNYLLSASLTLPSSLGCCERIRLWTADTVFGQSMSPQEGYCGLKCQRQPQTCYSLAYKLFSCETSLRKPKREALLRDVEG